MKATVTAAQLIFRVSILASIAVAITTSFLSYKTLDSNVPYGSNSFFVVTSVDDTLAEGKATELMHDAASAHHTNFLRVIRDRKSPVDDRALYTFVGDAKLFEHLYPESAYPAFSASASTAIKAPDRLSNAQILGAYSSTSEPSELAGAIQQLRVSGITISLEEVPKIRSFSETALSSPFAPVAWSTLFGLTISTIYYVSQRQRILKIKLVHGYSKKRAETTELLETTLFFIACCVGATPVVASGLWLYNRFQQIGPFSAQTLLVLGAMLAVVLFVQVISQIFLEQDSEVAVISGKRSSLLLGGTIYVAQVLIVAIAALTMIQCVEKCVDLRNNMEVMPKWESAAGHVGVNFEAQSDEQLEESVLRFGTVVADLERLAQTIVVYRPSHQSLGLSSVGPDQNNSLVVNEIYLNEESPELAGSAQSYAEALESSDILLLVPEQYVGDIERIERDYRDWTKFQQSQLTAPAPAPAPAIRIRSLFTKSHQIFFNYDFMSPSIKMAQLDPVVVVITAKSEILSPQFYAAAASQGGVLFKDPENLAKKLEAAGLSEKVSPTQDAAELAGRAVEKQMHEISALVPATLFVTLLLLLSSVLSSTVQCDRRRTENFVRRIHGWSRAKTYLPFGFAVFLGSLIASTVALLGAGSASSSSFPVIAGCVGISTLGAVLGITIFERQFEVTDKH